MTPEMRARITAFLERPALARVLAALNGEGEETRVVGGAVRNLLLGTEAIDVDLATTALPEETMRRGRAAGVKPVPTGIEHGTVTLVGEGESFEVTTLRQDVETDGRRAKVMFGRDFAADALRRDFTINALGLDRAGQVHDYGDGLADLAARRIRFIGDARARIREDYLRILRFFRFQAQYGVGEPDAAGLAACIAGRDGLKGLSRERVRAETMKLLVAPRAAETVRAMAGAGLLMPVIGGVPHPSRFAAVAEDDGADVFPAFRLAALAVCVREDALRLRERLRLSNAEFDRIERIGRALERLAGQAGAPALAALRHAAFALGSDAAAAALVLLNTSADDARRGGVQCLIAELARTPVFSPTGKDVIGLEVPPGPRIGQILEAARHRWIEAGCPPGLQEQMALLGAAVEALRQARA
ncbi:CCA tRNA nucleotidyltransferase [Bosea sp. (in: a-proteobacteria)]|uniref:CCA tRNA nucleotidyltransferase n=1 Tax=Bosea sp. (in: a-proteobacteria) TaxID=1871050 RepID=UPI0012099379|nr:CCA tRNA nucleotidyltransferase [Bosea sp. (in: a-proteobacteria)]TAJ28534.1 MAG: CCA tRNA nucleotidyltransferase [Bosea sp. (in: a-proteobacteria)]